MTMVQVQYDDCTGQVKILNPAMTDLLGNSDAYTLAVFDLDGDTEIEWIDFRNASSN
jgi:hypothetical protein